MSEGPARYRSKPSEIEAVQWTGDNEMEIAAYGTTAIIYDDGSLRLLAGKDWAQEFVPVPIGHWIARAVGDLSDHWLVDPDSFASKYEAVES